MMLRLSSNISVFKNKEKFIFYFFFRSLQLIQNITVDEHEFVSLQDANYGFIDEETRSLSDNSTEY